MGHRELTPLERMYCVPDVRRKQKCCNADLVELGSPALYREG